MASSSRNSWTSWQLRSICCLCQMFAIGMVACVPAYCLFLTHISPDTSPLSMRYAIGLACYFSLNLSVNWMQFRRKLVSNDAVAKTAVGCKDCTRCCSLVPAGSYHCPVCDFCVWRRDHHCFFLGGCVGFSNLLNFVSFCLNACLGCSYALVLMYRYLGAEFHALWSRYFMYYVIPYTFARWMLEDVASRHFVAVVLLNAVLGAFISTLFMFLWQAYLILVSKTSYEFFRGEGSAGVPSTASWCNLERTLGGNWFLHLFIPAFTLSSQALITQPKKDSLNEAMKYV